MKNKPTAIEEIMAKNDKRNDLVRNAVIGGCLIVILTVGYNLTDPSKASNSKSIPTPTPALTHTPSISR